MKVLEFIYNEKSISFDPTRSEDMMVNATEMAKAFGKRIDVFLKSDNTQEFIDTLIESLNEEKTGNEFPPNGGNSELINRADILQTRGQNGTWMHRYLAIEFARWLDVRFNVWITKIIDKILLGYYRELQVATYEKLAAEKEVNEKREALLANNPEFVEFLKLEGRITEAEKKRQKALKASMAQLKMDFQNS